MLFLLLQKPRPMEFSMTPIWLSTSRMFSLAWDICNLPPPSALMTPATITGFVHNKIQLKNPKSWDVNLRSTRVHMRCPLVCGKKCHIDLNVTFSTSNSNMTARVCQFPPGSLQESGIQCHCNGILCHCIFAKTKHCDGTKNAIGKNTVG